MKQGVIFVMLSVARCAFGLTCYGCTGASCTQPTCDSGSNDCQTTRIITTASETVMHSCSETANCQPLLFNTSASLTAMTCCETDQCNDGTNAPLEPNLAYCYSASCYGEGCMPGMIDYIDSNDIGTYCAASEDGCQTSMTMTTSVVSGEPVLQVTTGCASTACVSVAQYAEDTVVKTYCCKGRLCNNGGETSTDENKDYCYSYGCVSSTTCLSVSDAAAQGNVAYCEKPSDGCFYSRIVTSDSTIITAGCVGQSPENNNCTAVYSSIDDLETRIICCNSDKCNNGNMPAVDPNKKYCYVYSCISAPCTPIADVIQQGKISYCEQSDSKGCMSSSFISPDSTVISAGCVGVTPGMDTCTAMSSSLGDMDTSVSCCSSNLCNAGDSTDIGQDYCHVYTCASTSGSCTSLSDAIKEGKTTKCQKSDKGCFAMKTDTSLSAGCVGESTGMTECKATPPTGGTEIVCCKTDGCNSRFTSGSGPLFDHGGVIFVLLASMFLQLLGNI